MDDHGTIIACNKTLSNIFGYPVSDLEGANVKVVAMGFFSCAKTCTHFPLTTVDASHNRGCTHFPPTCIYVYVELRFINRSCTTPK